MLLGSIAILLIIVLFSKIGKLESRITDLERGTTVSLKNTPTTPIVPQKVSQSSFSYPTEAKNTGAPIVVEPVSLEVLMRTEPTQPPLQNATPPASKEERVVIHSDAPSKFVVWLKEDWLLKVGAFVVFLGFVWLVSYAFSNGWVGPIGKIGLGLLAGTGILLLGWKRILRFPAQGSVFLVLGAVTILLVTFAGRSLYQFFTPVSAMAIMFLSCAFLAFVSVRFERFSLALSGLLLSSVVPLFVSTGVPNYVGLYSYLMIVVVGSLWVVAVTEWKGITLGALIMVVFYSVPQLSGTTSADLGVTLLFIYVFTAIFFLANVIGIIRRKKSPLELDLIIAMINGLNILAWIHVAAVENWRSLIMSAWMVLFVVGAFLISLAIKRREPFYVYAGIGLSMLATATAEELHGASLTLAYMFETVAVILITQQILRNTRVTQKMSFLVIGPAILTIKSMFSPLWDTGVFHQDFIVVLMMVLVFLGLGVYFKTRPADQGTEDGPRSTISPWVNHLVLGVVYATMLLALIFNGPNLTLAYIAEVLVVIYFAQKLFSSIRVVEKVSMLMAGPVLLSLRSATSATWDSGILHKDFIVMIMMILVFFGLAAYFKQKEVLVGVESNTTTGVWASYLVLGVIYVTMLLALIFDGANLTLAYILESIAVILLAERLFGGERVTRYVSPLVFAPAFLSLQSVTSLAWNNGVFHKDFVVLLSVVGLFVWVGSRIRRSGSDGLRYLPLYFGFAALFASVLVWVVSHAGFEDKDSATTLALVVYTITGIWGYTKGRLRSNNALRIGGLSFLLFVFARLFFVDIWQMGIAGRIVTFFLVGTLLMSTAFYTRKSSQNT